MIPLFENLGYCTKTEIIIAKCAALTPPEGKKQTGNILYHIFISHFYANIASFFPFFSFNDIQFVEHDLELQYVQKKKRN